MNGQARLKWAFEQMMLVIILVNIPSLSAWGATDELWTCGDTRVSEREFEREVIKGQHEPAAAIFTIAGLTVNKSLLTDAEAMFGPSTPASTSHPTEALGECYKSAQWPGDPTVVTFGTSVMTDFKELTGFELESDSSPEAARCVTSSAVRSDLATGNGLRLGLSQTDMQKILGPGSPGAKGIRRWHYLGEIPNDAAEAKRSGQPYYFKYSGVTARFRDSKADCISVFLIKSY